MVFQMNFLMGGISECGNNWNITNNSLSFPKLSKYDRNQYKKADLIFFNSSKLSFNIASRTLETTQDLFPHHNPPLQKPVLCCQLVLITDAFYKIFKCKRQ